MMNFGAIVGITLGVVSLVMAPRLGYTLGDNPKTNIKTIVFLSALEFPTNPVLANLASAQAILESNLYGKPSKLAKENNNLFGIKGKGTAGSATMFTREFIKGKLISTTAGFAKNNSLQDSFSQYHSVIKKDRYKKVRNCNTFECAATEVKKAGWATDPTYTTQLIVIYKKYLQ